MKLFKRTLALALALCLTLSMGILVASAADTDTINYKLNVADIVTAGDYLNANNEQVKMTGGNNSATSNDNYRAAMKMYFDGKTDMVLVAAKKPVDGTRAYYVTSTTLSGSYAAFEDGFYLNNAGADGWSAFFVRNPGNGSYNVSFDYYKTPATANAMDVYAMPASVVTNVITDDRGAAYFLSHATVKATDAFGETSTFGDPIEAAIANGTAVKLGSSKDMTVTADASTSAKTTVALTDNKLTFANGEDMIIVFKNTEKENASSTYARQLLFGISMTKASAGGEQPGGEQPGGEQPDGPAQTGETAPIMAMGLLMVISLAAVCVVAKKRAA